ncbi:phosphotransferase family protein [Paenibacillus lautus]|uniref:phosphotransferase family protein n=1 Tax=Paenibacillus lautus TaxID=1401 RepID=UPI000BBDA722|nr:phosphotransferase [Paenibacillus lautus]PCL90217.1 aminoglycoside phosphotransferase [Paenibacillus lautus]
MLYTLGQKIGEGGCSEVFEVGNNRIIKLAKENTSFEALRREYLNNCIAWECGLPIPQPFELTKMSGRPGIVFEHIAGKTMMERFFNQVIVSHNNEVKQADVQLTAQLLFRVHQALAEGKELPCQKSIIKSNILSVNYLSASEKESAISLLESLETKQCLCHGDPNPRNVIVKDDGEAILLDWMNATIGNPEADIAEYIVMIRYAVLPSSFPEETRDMFDSIRENLIDIFMDEYYRLSGISYDDVEPWIIPILARKLSADAISDVEKKKLVAEIRRDFGKQKNRV